MAVDQGAAYWQSHKVDQILLQIYTTLYNMAPISNELHPKSPLLMLTSAARNLSFLESASLGNFSVVSTAL